LLEIVHILPGSTADGLGLQAGDMLDSVNGKEVHDVIDYRFLIADERIIVAYHSKDGRSRKLIIEKDPDDNLGLEFPQIRITRCRNRCIFCFVDQMPSGCRKSLYIKDDDFRASFLHGNYITLGALSEHDWERIFRERLSPLYISVHTTDHVLRTFMLGNKRAPDILASMKRLAKGGIRMHTQIVLCPGINDGDHLQKTLDDLSGLFPAVASIAVVPVGLTSYRKKLFPLRSFTRSEARSVIERIARLGSRFKRQIGTRLVFASDEFFIKAGESFPPLSFYEELPQIENGVGMVSEFLRDVSRTRIPKKTAPINLTLVTGVSFSSILKRTIERLKTVDGPRIRLVIAQNFFFGPSVTVAGLLTGQDILRALKGKRLGDMVVIPSSSLKEDEDLFLDNTRLVQLEQALSVKVRKVDKFSDILAVLRGEGRRSR
jgi:putative radical SAM enzyme (TIGR03279 family)